MAIESEWAVEMRYDFQRATTPITVEAAAGTSGTIAIPLTAFTDGSDWGDLEGFAPWSDWPPANLVAIAQQEEG